jgi:hypothetical protein
VRGLPVSAPDVAAGARAYGDAWRVLGSPANGLHPLARHRKGLAGGIRRQSGRRDLNPRSRLPKSRAMTRLRYAPWSASLDPGFSRSARPMENCAGRPPRERARRGQPQWQIGEMPPEQARAGKGTGLGGLPDGGGVRRAAEVRGRAERTVANQANTLIVAACVSSIPGAACRITDEPFQARVHRGLLSQALRSARSAFARASQYSAGRGPLRRGRASSEGRRRRTAAPCRPSW